MKTDICIIAGALLVAGCSGEQEAAPYGTAQQLMAQEVQPTAEIYWESVGAASELIDGEAVFREWAPETDAEWEEVRMAAARLGELGAVMQTPAYAEGRGDDWLAYSRGLVDVAAEAEAIAAAKDSEGVFEIGGTIYQVCSACHRMYPPAQLPEGTTVDDIQQMRPGDELTAPEGGGDDAE